MGWNHSKQKQRILGRQRRRFRQGRAFRRGELPGAPAPAVTLDEELELLCAPTVAALAFPMIIGGAFDLQPPKVRKELLIIDPFDGATVPIELAVRIFTSGLEDGSRLFLHVDQLWVTPGEPLELAPGRILLAPGRSEALLMLDEGKHVLCAQAADPEGRALELFDVIEVRVTLPREDTV